MVFFHAALQKSGYHQIYTFEYSCCEALRMETGRRLADFLSLVAADHPARVPIVIGASLGGLVARSGLIRLGNPESIGGLITLARPHRGSSWAALAPKSFSAVGRNFKVLCQGLGRNMKRLYFHII